MPELAFVTPGAAATWPTDLVAAISEEVNRQDAVARLYATFPREPRADRVYVVVQGERDIEIEPTPPELSRTILVMLAPPGSGPFEQALAFARLAGAVFHPNSVAVEELHQAGVPAKHLQLGYALSWDLFEPGGARNVPIAPADDLELLPRAQLAVVRGCHGYFDWPQALSAIHHGAVVLHEHSLGSAPLVAGHHLFFGSAAALDTLGGALLRDLTRLDRVREEARGFVRSAIPLALAAAALVGVARALVAQPLPWVTNSMPGQFALRSK